MNKVYSLEYYGGEYSDSWTTIKGVFSSREKAMEWCRANPNDHSDYGYGENHIEEQFSIYEMSLDDPSYVAPPSEMDWFHHPEIVAGTKIRITGYHPNAGPDRVKRLHQIGTVVRRDYDSVDLVFEGSKKHWSWKFEYVEVVD